MKISSLIRIFRHISSWILIIAFSMMVVNKTIYLHAHRMADGSIVTHAHPFNKTTDKAPVKTHHHSMAEFILLDSIDKLFFAASLIFALLQIRRKKGILRLVLPVHEFAPVYSIKGRAPPSL